MTDNERGPRPLGEFLAKLRASALERGDPPLSEADRAEIRAACLASAGKVSPEAMAIASTPEAIAETLAAIDAARIETGTDEAAKQAQPEG